MTLKYSIGCSVLLASMTLDNEVFSKYHEYHSLKETALVAFFSAMKTSVGKLSILLTNYFTADKKKSC